MEKLIWRTVMSLDGYIAGRGDDMDWVFRVDGGPGETVAEEAVGIAREAAGAGDPVRLVPTASIEEGETTVLPYSAAR